MNKQVLNIIEQIKSQQDYNANNDDFLDPYWDFIDDEYTYNNDHCIKTINTWLSEYTDFDIDDDHPFNEWLTDQVMDNDTTYLKLSVEHGISSKDNELFSIENTENHIYLEVDPKLPKLTPEDVQTIENETDTYIPNDASDYDASDYYAIDYDEFRHISCTIDHDMLIDCINDLVQSFNENESEISEDSHHGQYIPLVWAEAVLNNWTFDHKNNTFKLEYKDTLKRTKITTITGLAIDDVRLLADKKNLDFNVCEYYWDTWNDVLNNVTYTYQGKNWNLDQDGDLWLKSEYYIHTDI